MAYPKSGFAARASLGELVRTLPARQLMLLWLAIFSTLATIAFMIDIIVGGRFPIAWLASMALVSGTLSVGFTVTSLRRRWFAFASLVAADIVYITIMRRFFELNPAAPGGRLVSDAVGTLIGISIGYTLFILFMNATATRYLRTQAQLAVAHEIHQLLVPSIAHTVGEYEFFGWSIPSGEVGGDLVDVVLADGRWVGYVADVSGTVSVPAFSWRSSRVPFGSGPSPTVL